MINIIIIKKVIVIFLSVCSTTVIRNATVIAVVSICSNCTTIVYARTTVLTLYITENGIALLVSQFESQASK